MGTHFARIAVTCALAVSGGAWLLAQQTLPQQTPPAFQTDVDIVRLDVSVLDEDRRPVRGLTAADFTLLVDGRERPIVAFAPVVLPPVAATPGPATSWVRDAPRDVVTNAGADEGRLVVLVFDWSIRFYDQGLARRIAHAAIDGLGPGDRAAVVFADPAANAGVPQNFTADRALLRAAIDRPFAVATTVPCGASPDTDPNSGYNCVGISYPDRHDSGGCHCGTCSLTALTRVAEGLSTVPQRPKVVLFIGTYGRTFEAVGRGRNQVAMSVAGYPMGEAFQIGACHVPLADARNEMVRAIGEANATVHVLDPVGIETQGNSPLGGDLQRIRDRQAHLPVIADLTGGRAVVSAAEPEAQIPAIFEESSAYYLLGFAPDRAAPDDRAKRIEIRLRRSGLTVKTRDRYLRTEPSASMLGAGGDLADTISGVLPASAVPFEASVVPLIVGGDATTATLVIGRLGVGTSMTLEGLTLVSAAFTPRGAEVGSKRVTLRPVDGGEPPTVLGLISRLEIEPGLHEVRIAAQLANGMAGSVNTFVDVPDFRRNPLSMSGVVVRVTPEEPMAPLEELPGVLPFVPTARRAFDRTETVSALVQVSQGTSRTETLRPVTLRVRVIDMQDNAVRDQTLILTPEDFSTSRTATPSLALPVQNLSAGEYLLSLDATSGEHSAVRAVRFQVR